MLILCNHKKTSGHELEKILELAKNKIHAAPAYWNELIYHYQPQQKNKVYFDIKNKLEPINKYKLIYLRADTPIEEDVKNIIIREARKHQIALVGTVPKINPTLVKNKADTTHYCSENFNIVFPETFFGHHKILYKYFDFIAKKLKTPLICKPNGLRKGFGVVKLSNKKDFKKYAEKIRQEFGLRKSYFLLQKYIENNADYRILVLGKKTYCMKRRATKPGEFRHNFSLGGTVEKVELPADLRRQSVKIARRLGLDFAGVDFIKKHGKFICLEVNKSPGLAGISQANNKDLFMETIDYLIKKRG